MKVTVDQSLLVRLRDLLGEAHIPEGSADSARKVRAELDLLLADPPPLVNPGKGTGAGGIPWRGEDPRGPRGDR